MSRINIPTGLRGFLILLLILAGILKSAQYPPTNVGNVLLAVASLLVITLYLYVSSYKIEFKRLPGIVFFSIMSVYIILLISGEYGLLSLFRIFSYLVIGYTCMFVVPNLIDEDVFLKFVSILATTTVVLGIFAYVVGTVSFLTISEYNHPRYYFAGNLHRVYAIESIFASQNTFGPVAFFGAVFSLAIYNINKKVVYLLIFIINFIGIYLSRSRAAMLAFIAAVVILLLYKFDNQKLVAILIGLSLPGVLLVTAIGAGILPDPLHIRTILGSRHALWVASVEAVSEYNYIGAGPIPAGDAVTQANPSGTGGSPHNAFLRVFVTGGVVAGLGYILLFVFALRSQIRQRLNTHPAIASGFVGICVLQLFEAWLLFSMSFLSVVSSAVFGYIYLRDQPL